MVNILGPRDEFLQILERELEAGIHVRGNEITLTGSPTAVDLAVDVITELVTVLRTGQGLTADAVERICTMLTTREDARPADVLTHNILSARGKTIRPKTLNQKRYVDAIFAAPVGKTSDVVLIADGGNEDGLHLFKVFEEEERTPDGRQLEDLKVNAFGDWYAEKKDALASSIDRGEGG